MIESSATVARIVDNRLTFSSMLHHFVLTSANTYCLEIDFIAGQELRGNKFGVEILVDR